MITPSRLLSLTFAASLSSIVIGCTDDPAPEPNACANIQSGEAAHVTFTIRNVAPVLRYYTTKCTSPFYVRSPNGGYAPANPDVLMCDTAPTSCKPGTCADVGFMPLQAGASQSFDWNGIVFVSVNAAENGCTAANAGEFCFPYCARTQDGESGKYNVTLRVYEEDLTLTEWKTTFSYPAEKEVVVEIP